MTREDSANYFYDRLSNRGFLNRGFTHNGTEWFCCFMFLLWHDSDGWVKCNEWIKMLLWSCFDDWAPILFASHADDWGRESHNIHSIRWFHTVLPIADGDNVPRKAAEPVNCREEGDCKLENMDVNKNIGFAMLFFLSGSKNIQLLIRPQYFKNCFFLRHWI